MNPQDIVNDLCSRVEVLHPQNIDRYVQEERRLWLSSRGRPSFIGQPSKKTGLFNLVEAQHKALSTSHTFTCGSWCLTLPTSKGVGLSVSVWNGCRYEFHPEAARLAITTHWGEITYRQWKRHVMANYQDSMRQVMEMAAEQFPGFVAFSSTCCESSKHLMAQTPHVYLQKDVAILILLPRR